MYVQRFNIWGAEVFPHSHMSRVTPFVANERWMHSVHTKRCRSPKRAPAASCILKKQDAPTVSAQAHPLHHPGISPPMLIEGKKKTKKVKTSSFLFSYFSSASHSKKIPRLFSFIDSLFFYGHADVAGEWLSHCFLFRRWFPLKLEQWMS